MSTVSLITKIYLHFHSYDSLQQGFCLIMLLLLSDKIGRQTDIVRLTLILAKKENALYSQPRCS